MAKTALVAGATGLVGQALVRRLLESNAYDRVIAAVRRPLGPQHTKLKSVVVDFHRLEEYFRELAADDVFCALGTTIKEAGSREAFRRVDYDYCLSTARVARRVGARTFVGVSSLGADPNSRVFYSRVKGELEAAVAKVGVPRYYFVRPSLLAGERDTCRPGERVGLAIGRALGPVMLGPLARYRPIDATVVAEAMIALANSPRSSGAVESDALLGLAAT